MHQPVTSATAGFLYCDSIYTKLTLDDVCERLCFDSIEYFSSSFKKRVGNTPKVCRGMLIAGKIEKAITVL